MILNNPENRKQILKYLESVNEDDFIDDFIIPFFFSKGFTLFRRNSHGPGEHGKDIIFCNYVQIFDDLEYWAIQAKAQPIKTSNVVNISDQLRRAWEIPFPLRKRGGRMVPDYVVLVNARRHNNEATEALNGLLKNESHIRVLSQENVCELILKSGIAPQSLLDQLSMDVSSGENEEDRIVSETLNSGSPAEIDELLDNKLLWMKKFLSEKSKELVVEYIYHRWMQDRSWGGTVKPMRWLNSYFDFMTEEQYEYLIPVFEEICSAYPSFDARSDTLAIVNKVKPEQLTSISDAFIRLCGERTLSMSFDNIEILISKLRELRKSGLIKDDSLITVMDSIIKADNEQRQGKSLLYRQGENLQYREYMKKIFEFIHPTQENSSG